jgi:hypothetical protein
MVVDVWLLNKDIVLFICSTPHSHRLPVHNRFEVLNGEQLEAVLGVVLMRIGAPEVEKATGTGDGGPGSSLVQDRHRRLELEMADQE